MSYKPMYFKPREYRCKCGCGFEPSAEMLETMDTVREWYASPLIITSGARCRNYNSMLRSRGIPAAHRSAHTEGLAVDVTTKDLDGFKQFIQDNAELLQIWYERFTNTPNWVHIQIRCVPGKKFGPFIP